MPSKPSEDLVILNNSPLSSLWSINHMWLLRDLYTEVMIPQAVYDEFLAKSTASRRTALENAPWIKLTPLSDPRQALVYIGLDRGEAEVLALAIEKSARLVVIDEQKGRRYAKRLGVSVTGTLGMLGAAKRGGIIPTVAPLIDQLLETGSYLSPMLIDKILKDAGEK